MFTGVQRQVEGNYLCRSFTLSEQVNGVVDWWRLQCFEWFYLFYVSWRFLLILFIHHWLQAPFQYIRHLSCDLKPSFLLGSLWTAACRLCISSCFCCLQSGNPAAQSNSHIVFGADWAGWATWCCYFMLCKPAKVWGFLYVNGRQTEQTTKAMGGAPPGAGGSGGGSSPGAKIFRESPCCSNRKGTA